MRSVQRRVLLPIVMFGVAALFYFYEFLLRVAPSVMFPELMADFHLDANKFGILSACYYWSYAAMQIPVGALTDRYGPRRWLTFAIVLCALATLCFAWTSNFYVACFLRFLIGAGSAFAFICCMKIITIWFRSDVFPLLVGLTLTIGTLGALSGVSISYFLKYMTWKTLFIGLGVVGILMAFLAWGCVRDQPSWQTKVPTGKSVAETGVWYCLKMICKQPQNWLVAFYSFLVTAPTDALGATWSVPFLSHVHHIIRDHAAWAASMTFLGLACGSPFLGWLTGRWGVYRKPMFLASLIACFSLIALIYLPVLNVWTAGILHFLFGFWGGYVLSFVVIRILNESQYIATAVGFVNMLSMLGSAFLTSFIGFTLDQVSSTEVLNLATPVYTSIDYHWGLFLVPVFYAVSAVLVVPFIREK